jgi:hypothetical protein
MPIKTQARVHRRRGFGRRHGLSLTVGGVIVVLILLYRGADPGTHLGGFYGNAIADWLGTLIIVIATKYLYEIGSAESRKPHPGSRSPLACFCIDHSLTIALIVTGIGWAVAYARMDPQGKYGQVVGNIVSEWTQILGLVLMTKYLGEFGSKEG